MSWKEIIKVDRLNKALSPEGYRRMANELVDGFAKRVRLPYVLIASQSELLEWKSSQSPEDAPRHIKHFARLLDIHRDKIPKESHSRLDKLIEQLNEIAGYLE